MLVSAFVGVSGVFAEDGGVRRVSPPPVHAAAGAADPTLRLAWLDVAGVPAGVEGIARKETESVLERLGLEAGWRRARTEEAAREGEIRVVIVDRLLVDPDTGRPILGATTAERRAFPVVWVHLAGVRATLGLRSRSPGHLASLRERREMGLAVGRVTAHEVIHVVAPSLAHGRGLMSRALTRAALTAPRISFEPGVALVVRASLLGAPVPEAATSGMLAASGSLGEAGEAVAGEPLGIADADPREAGFHPDAHEIHDAAREDGRLHR